MVLTSLIFGLLNQQGSTEPVQILLKARIYQKGKLISAPTIRTISNMEATISVSGRYTARLLPTLKPDGSISTDFEITFAANLRLIAKLRLVQGREICFALSESCQKINGPFHTDTRRGRELIRNGQDVFALCSTVVTKGP